MIRRPPRSTLFPTRRSSDLSTAARASGQPDARPGPFFGTGRRVHSGQADPCAGKRRGHWRSEGGHGERMVCGAPFGYREHVQDLCGEFPGPGASGLDQGRGPGHGGRSAFGSVTGAGPVDFPRCAKNSAQLSGPLPAQPVVPCPHALSSGNRKGKNFHIFVQNPGKGAGFFHIETGSLSAKTSSVR